MHQKQQSSSLQTTRWVTSIASTSRLGLHRRFAAQVAGFGGSALLGGVERTRLREQVRGDEADGRLLVRDDKHLRGPSGHVDGHHRLAVLQQHLGRRHVLVAGPENLVHLRASRTKGTRQGEGEPGRARARNGDAGAAA